MNWETIQQLIRILMNAVGMFLFGDAIANGAEYQALIGGVLSVGAFAWWWFWERTRPATP